MCEKDSIQILDAGTGKNDWKTRVLTALEVQI